MENFVLHENSSILASSKYNKETSELVVTFKTGQAYRYEGVEDEDYANFISGESAGKSFNQYIRKYKSTKL